MVANKERIYVGGLDPSRGLTVELVASRLCMVDGVGILSINDVATTKSTSAVDNTTNTNTSSSSSSIYTNKQSIIDEDGDLVDTRNFFFLEARSTTAAVDGDDNEKKSNTNHHNSSTQSALDILSKQYNSVKWKGCQLRVESAKPHFLHRLQDERQQIQLAKNQATQLKSAQDVINTQQQLEDIKTVIKCRRRLRIRKRFGEEAYHVDTQPHSIELSTNNQQQTPTTTPTNAEVANNNNNNNNNGGWDSFAFLHKRLKNKRKSQQWKLIERRKKERRLWASSGSGKNHEQQQEENVDELNSLIFLNRGIHIRFNDEAVSSSLSSMDKNSDSSREVISTEETAAMKSTKEVEDNVEAYTSSSSSAVSSDSEESTSVANREKKVYNWSDDSEEENNECSSSSGDSSTDGEEDKSTKKYVWSDDEDEESISDSTNNKGTKKMIDGSAYIAAAAVDEFSGGMDFDIESNSDDDGNASYNSGDEDDDDSAAGGGEEVHVCLEDDITSNMGILSKMFPNDSFEKQPLAAPIANDGEENDNDTTNGGVVKQQQSSLYGGAGLIMQRYDPTKESDKRFEVPQVKQDDNNDVEKQPSSQQQEDKDDILSEDTNNELPASKIDEEEGEENSTLKEKIELTKEEEKAATYAEENSAPAKDIYEQEKLDDIFKQSREGKSSFSLTNMFQTDDNKNVYEQDKLESVFKEARADSSGGFSFGFQSELPHDSIPADDDKGGFSFGFDTGNNTSTENEGPEENNTTTDTAPQALPTSMEEAAVHDQPKAKSSTKRRKGMRFPESDLDKYEDMFFSLNEGPTILKDLDGMKQNEANQEQWQKERLILTADWKRKVKAKKPTKKTRR